MRKVIGIGETILDIIFRGDQPSAAVPGGSVFNGIVSLGRMGIKVGFISETGNDRVGNIILQFMRENNIPFEVIGTKNIDTEDADVMILSHVAAIRDEEMDKIEAYVNRGGNLYISGPVGHPRLQKMSSRMVNHLYHWHSSMNRAMLNISSIRIIPSNVWMCFILS